MFVKNAPAAVANQKWRPRRSHHLVENRGVEGNVCVHRSPVVRRYEIFVYGLRNQAGVRIAEPLA